MIYLRLGEYRVHCVLKQVPGKVFHVITVYDADFFSPFNLKGVL